jgi:hypothetical protein
VDDGLGGDANVAESPPQDAACGAAPAPRVLVSNVVGVVRLGYELATRRLLSLLVPAAVLFVPAGVISGGLIVAAVGRHALIVNGDLHVVSASPGLVVGTIAALVVVFTGYAMALAATAMMSAGLLLGRPVRPGAAVRAAGRRPVTLSALGVMVGALGALALAADIAMTRWAVWAGVATFAVVLLSGWWLTLGLPIAMLDGRGAWQSVRRAWSVSRQRRTRQSIALTLGMLVGPGLFIAGVRWALSPLDGAAHIVLGNAVIAIASVIMMPFQAGTLAVAALNQHYPVAPLSQSYPGSPEEKPGEPLDLVRVAGRLSGTGSVLRRTRCAVLLVALLPLPGLLYGGYVWRNPLGLPTDHNLVKDRFGRYPAALHLLPGERAMGISPDLSARVCADAGCADSRLYNGYDMGAQVQPIGTATLPDGTVATAAWLPQHPGSEDGRGPRALRLLRCGADGCGSSRTSQNAPIVARSDSDVAYSEAAAMTVTRDGIVIAAVLPDYQDNRDGGHDLGLQLRLIRCADIRCSARHTAVILRQRLRGLGIASRPIAVAADQDGRPVVAYQDHTTVNVIACDSADCRHPQVTQLTPQVERLDLGLTDKSYMDGVDIAVPPDHRPVLTYRDPRTGAARLLRCRTFDCTQAANTALSGPGPWQSRPALTLDRDGRPLIATYNRDMLILVACQDFGCDRRRRVALAKLENGPGFLDLAVRRDGHPLVLWRDGLPLSGGPLHLTTCARPRCGV